MSNLELFDRAAGATMCNVLRVAGPTLVRAGIWALKPGPSAVVGGGLMGAGAASMLASNYLCEEMDLGENPGQGNGENCQKVSGYGEAQFFDPRQQAWRNPFEGLPDSGIKSKSATEVVESTVSATEDGGWDLYLVFATQYGPITWWDYYSGGPKPPVLEGRIVPTEGECVRYDGGPQPLPPDVYKPQTYVDQLTNCTYNVTFQGFAEVTPDGEVQPVLLIESAAEQRNDGGRMGGCVLAPTIYMPGGGGGTTIPGPPGPPSPPGPPVIPGGDEVPWWLPPLLAATTGALLNAIFDAINDTSKKEMEPGAFTLTAPCDKDDKDEPLKAVWTFDAQPYYERIHDQQVVMMEIMQQHLNWKTPICGNERPAKEGEWVTTRWISDEKMDHSNHRLRKLFRYRTKSTRDLGQLSTYWRDFVWQAGDVCVRHEGAWWGNPQVWASTEAEGQRVIRHAASEAGLDPDQDGQWAFSSSNSPRYGMPGTMRIQMHEGFPWVAKREGASYPNTLALAHDP
jgi:hypothetical protein